VREKEEGARPGAGPAAGPCAAHAGEKREGEVLGLGLAWARKRRRGSPRRREGEGVVGLGWLLLSFSFLSLFHIQTIQTTLFEFK
jgi:hypothetical protein